MSFPFTLLQPSEISASAGAASATGLLSMLAEPAPSVRKAALQRLSAVVDTQWHEVAQSLPDLEAISEDMEEEIEVRQLAASIASRVFFYLEEPSQALRLALESGDGVFETSGSQSNKAFVECLVGAAVDAYIQKKGKEHNGEDEKEEDAVSALPMEKLQAVVEFMFDRCYSEGNFEHALGIALEAQEIEKVRAVLDQCSQRCGGEKLYQVLNFSFTAATTLFISKSFRYQVIQVITEKLESLSKDSNVVASTRNNYSFSLAKAFQVLKDPKAVSTILCNLLDGSEHDSLYGLQLCFDLVESGDQAFVNGVADALPTKGDESGRSDDIWTRYEKARRVLTGGLTSELAISFLHKHSDSDPLIMENLKQGLEARGGGRNSTLHNCAVLTHSYLNAGTTNDAFLRDNLEWMKKASNWAKFSATASLGVVHGGHISEAMNLLEPYLPPSPESNDGGVSEAGGFAEGGSLYALGLIHGSQAGSASDKRKETHDFLLNHLRISHANEPISHGAALGVGLTGLGTNSLSALNELKELLYTDSAVSGEAAGIAMGLILVGSGAGNVHNNLNTNTADEINEIVSELKTYARETQHEKIIRGIVMGLALMQYGQEENADFLIDEMRGDRDPILRYGAQYCLALAYCGTGSNKAIRLLLHTAVSDVSDDVRMAAVIGLAFVLYKTPKRVPELVKLLLESFNPHVRYASCMAVGIAMAGSGDSESIALLEPMLTDMTDFVRQGALMGTALIYMQQSDQCNGRKVKTFREKLAALINDKHQTTLTKMGAILSTGIIDAGGRNCSFNLGSKNGFTKMSSAVGVALWLQHWYWFPMMHMFSLAITPTYTICLNKDFKYPKKLEIQCNAKPSMFAYPKRVEEKKEEVKKRIETVTLSTTVKNKARLARKKAKEEGAEVDVKMEEENTKAEEEVKMDIDEPVTSEDKKGKKKREPEPTMFALSNPCRITISQVDYCVFKMDQRYHPIRPDEKPCGVILVTDSTPTEEDEDLGTIKAPSIESEDEADAPEPFEWTPPDHKEETKQQSDSIVEPSSGNE